MLTQGQFSAKCSIAEKSAKRSNFQAFYADKISNLTADAQFAAQNSDAGPLSAGTVFCLGGFYRVGNQVGQAFHQLGIFTFDHYADQGFGT